MEKKWRSFISIWHFIFLLFFWLLMIDLGKKTTKENEIIFMLNFIRNTRRFYRIENYFNDGPRWWLVKTMTIWFVLLLIHQSACGYEDLLFFSKKKPFSLRLYHPHTRTQRERRKKLNIRKKKEEKKREKRNKQTTTNEVFLCSRNTSCKKGWTYEHEKHKIRPMMCLHVCW